MLSRFLPRQTDFLQLFRQMTDLSLEAAQTHIQLLDDLEHREKYSSKIKSIEQHADEVTHHTIDLLHGTFITPIDREQIYELAKRLDDILDFIDGSAARLTLYDVRNIPKDLRDLADVMVEAVECVKKAVECLSNLKDRESLMRIVGEINHLENRADKILHDGVGKLFRDETDIKEIIKLKEIYEMLESVTDRCEDASDVIESIMVQNA